MTPLPHSATWLAGYIPDLPTPFDEAGEIDLAAFAKLCERQIQAGVSAIVAGETTGEASTLTPAEHDAIVRTAVKTANGRVRVIAGAGSNSTSTGHRADPARRAAGADAVLSVVPYYNKPMQAGIAAHFRAIANSTALPIILHDIPARTIRELSDDTLAELSQSRQFIALRDGTGDLARPIRLRSMVPSGFRLLSGDDATALAFLANGGDGCISVVSNLAPELCQVIFRLQAGTVSDRQIPAGEARAACGSARQENPAALKYALCLLGLMRPETRLPIVGLTDAAKAEVASVLAEMGEEYLACEGWEDLHPQREAAATSRESNLASCAG